MTSEHSVPLGHTAIPGELAQGTAVGRYIVLSRLGQGGMGVVYAAYDPELDRKIAVKILRRAGGLHITEGRLRLMREAHALAKLTHANVVGVHDAGIFEGQVFIAMDFVEGHTVTQWLVNNRPSPREVAQVFLAAGKGLAAAHAAGLVHRDFKSDNVLVGNDGRVRVLDFGLARAAESGLDPEPDGSELAAPGVLERPLTRGGAVPGTVGYLAPELFTGAPADEKSDQFGFCCALYEALYGELPFGKEPTEYFGRLFSGRPPEVPGRSSVPGSLRRVALRGLTIEPENRYPSMAALLADLSRDPWAKWRWVLTGGAVLLAAVVSYGLAARSNAHLCAGAEQRLAGTWDATIKSAMENARVVAADAESKAQWSQVIRRLDDFAGAWSRMYKDACEANRVRGDQSEEVLGLRMACLDSRLTDAAALVQTLGSSNDISGSTAQGAVMALGGVELCGDLGYLLAKVKPTKDPRVRARVDDLRRELAQVRALDLSGLWGKALERANRLKLQLDGLDYPPLEAEVLGALGRLGASMGDYAAAEANGLAAAVAAERSGHDEARAQALVILVYVKGYGLSRTDEALALAKLAQPAVERAQIQRELEGTLANAVAATLQARGRYAEAEQQYARALHINTRFLGRTHAYVGGNLANVGSMLVAQGRFREGIAELQKADELLAAAFAQHGDRAEVLFRLSEARVGLGELALARELATRALELWERSLGPQHGFVGLANAQLARISLEQGHIEAAASQVVRALEILSFASGPDVVGRLEVISLLAHLRDLQGRTSEAIALLEKTRNEAARALPADHPIHGQLLRRLAEHHARNANHRVAQPLFVESIAHLEQRLGNDHPELAAALIGLAKCELELGQPRRAAPLLERALEALARRPASPALLASAQFALARALRGSAGSQERVRSLVDSALNGYQASEGEHAAEIAVVRAWR